MNNSKEITENLLNYFESTKNTYINIVIILVLVTFFIIIPLPIPPLLSNLAKFLIILFSLFISYYNFNINLKIKNQLSKSNNSHILNNTILLTNIINFLLILLAFYIIYTIFF